MGAIARTTTIRLVAPARDAVTDPRQVAALAVAEARQWLQEQTLDAEGEADAESVGGPEPVDDRQHDGHDGGGGGGVAHPHREERGDQQDAEDETAETVQLRPLADEPAEQQAASEQHDGGEEQRGASGGSRS